LNSVREFGPSLYVSPEPRLCYCITMCNAFLSKVSLLLGIILILTTKDASGDVGDFVDLFEQLNKVTSAAKIFIETYNGRYRYSQRKDLNIIILTREGFAHGFFVIAALDEPTEKDKKEYPRVRRVYVVKESALFEKAVPVGAFGITGYQFGKISFRRTIQRNSDCCGWSTKGRSQAQVSRGY